MLQTTNTQRSLEACMGVRRVCVWMLTLLLNYQHWRHPVHKPPEVFGDSVFDVRIAHPVARDRQQQVKYGRAFGLNRVRTRDSWPSFMPYNYADTRLRSRRVHLSPKQHL